MTQDGLPDRSSGDRSNGYEAVATDFTATRSGSTVGCGVVRSWAEGLPGGSAVLDVGAGPGLPLTKVLIEAGLDVHAVEASATLAQTLKERFPGVTIACEAAEDSTLFGRSFTGVLAVGLVFLLAEETQRTLLSKLARALRPGGSLLFSAPWQVCAWNDVLTGRTSRSLGRQVYREVLESGGLCLVSEHRDEGQNHYFEAEKAL